MARAGRPTTPPPASARAERRDLALALARELVQARARCTSLEEQLEDLVRGQAVAEVAGAPRSAVVQLEPGRRRPRCTRCGRPGHNRQNCKAPPEDLPRAQAPPPPADDEGLQGLGGVPAAGVVNLPGSPEGVSAPPPAEVVLEERQVAITQELAPLEPDHHQDAAPSQSTASCLPSSSFSTPIEAAEEEECPLEPAPALCGCGCGQRVNAGPPGRPRHFLRGHHARVQSGRRSRGEVLSYQEGTAGPARLAELRRQIAAGTYVPFAKLRKAVA